MGSTARQLIIEEEFRDLIPPLTAEEREGLEADILRDGCLTPLLVWRGESGDVLLDGHNRREICAAHDFPYETEPVPGIESRDDAKRWIIDHQRHRRNLNEAQRAMLAGLLATIARGGDRGKAANERENRMAHRIDLLETDIGNIVQVRNRMIGALSDTHERHLGTALATLTEKFSKCVETPLLVILQCQHAAPPSFENTSATRLTGNANFRAKKLSGRRTHVIAPAGWSYGFGFFSTLTLSNTHA